MAERDEHKRDQKEIERIERPTKKAGDKRVPLFAIQDFEKPNRLHTVSCSGRFPQRQFEVPKSRARFSSCAISSKQK